MADLKRLDHGRDMTQKRQIVKKADKATSEAGAVPSGLSWWPPSDTPWKGRLWIEQSRQPLDSFCLEFSTLAAVILRLG